MSKAGAGNTARIAFVGAGAVAGTLARAMAGAGLDVVAIASRRKEAAAAVAADLPGTRVFDAVQPAVDAADLVFLTVPDDAIATVCGEAAWAPGQIAVHCSGATELTALAAARREGAGVGAFHPLQMFANPSVALDTLPGCTVTIEADEAPASVLHDIAARIGCRPLTLPQGRRALYHASATYVGPFVIAVLEEAATLWRELGVNEAGALESLMPLLRGTLAAVGSRGLAGGMGGCVSRGDVGTVRRHLEAIDQLSPEMADLYRELTRRTIPLALRRGTLAPDRAEEIRRAIGRPEAGDERFER